MRRGAKPAKAKIEARLSVARKAPKNDDSRVVDLEKRLAEALERETATSEILRVISSSPTDVQPTFEAIAARATRLCAAEEGTLFRFDGTLIHLAAHCGVIQNSLVRRVFPRPAGRGSVTARAILTRSVVHIPDVTTDPDLEQSVLITAGFRTVLSVPMLRDGDPIGAITVSRQTVVPFSDAQIGLLQTFADQAVIAVENVRLFNETKEALEQQRASGEILSVISSSPTDVQPVFDVIVQSAVRLCGGLHSNVYRVEDGLIHLVAHHNFSPAALEHLQRRFPMPVSQGEGLASRVIRESIPVHVHDAQTDPEVTEMTRRTARALGARSVLSVPMLRDRVGIGVIVVSRGEVKPFSDKEIALIRTFADQAVIAIENVRLFTELQERNRELTESLEQQTATAEILRVISSSPTELTPVFDSVLDNALRLCGAEAGILWLWDGPTASFRPTAMRGAPDAYAEFIRRAPIRPAPDTGLGRIAAERRTVHIADVAAEELYRQRDPLRVATVEALGARTFLAVPMLRESVLVGAFTVYRQRVEPFSERQVALIQTFADQAVIAIENVRLFTELQEKNRALTQAHAQVTQALERQTATSEILRVISQSQTDVQPVFDAIVRSAARLCEATFAALHRFDGKMLSFDAHHGMTEPEVEESHRRFPHPPTRETAVGRAILDRQTAHIRNIRRDLEYRVTAGQMTFQTVLAVPLLRDGNPIGAMGLWRREVRPFTDSQIELVKTFADQAVIAIENVRLFTETKEALERQTATSEVLRVISSSPTDLGPVFDGILRSAVSLCDALYGVAYRYDGALIHVMAHYNFTPEALKALDAVYPAVPGPETATNEAVRRRAVVHIPDSSEDPSHPSGQAIARRLGYRTLISVPMLREGEAIGAITVARRERRMFSDTQIALLQTFADQAVIAIENVRLFQELQARTQDLTRSVEQLTALGDVGRTLSSTLDLEAVLQTIVTRASQLAGTDACSVFEYDEATEAFHLRATNNLDEEVVTLARRTPIRKGEGVQGRMAITRQPVQVPDIAEEEAYRGPLRDILLRTGTRALLAIPMLREDQLIGGLTVNKKTAGEFAPEVIELLQTFATQSALAIQNARLFREIADKSRQLEAASQHKSEFLANMSHELRTPLNAIIGFSEVLAEGMFGEVNEKQTEYLRDILESGQHLLSLINDILDLSKIEAGRMELELTDFDLPQAISNAVTLVRERAGRRGIALHHGVDQRLGQVRADERKIKQVLLNLLSNALKFTPEGGRVEVRAGIVDDMAEIAVTDTGVGIAPEDQEAVFEEFRQVGTADKKVEGTGLGLALSRKFIELHGGRIWVKSQVGAGSTFTFTIPTAVKRFAGTRPDGEVLP